MLCVKRKLQYQTLCLFALLLKSMLPRTRCVADTLTDTPRILHRDVSVRLHRRHQVRISPLEAIRHVHVTEHDMC